MPASVEIITQPANGTLIVNADGTVIYQPRLGFRGQDAFSYRVQDENGFKSNVATVKITIDENVIEVPNVITPNGDGQNDKLVIKVLENISKTASISTTDGAIRYSSGRTTRVNGMVPV